MFFDNVGGEILEAALGNLAMARARRAVRRDLQLQRRASRTGPRNYMNLLVRRSRMEGFVVFDYFPRTDEAMAELVPDGDGGQDPPPRGRPRRARERARGARRPLHRRATPASCSSRSPPTARGLAPTDALHSNAWVDRGPSASRCSHAWRSPAARLRLRPTGVTVAESGGRLTVGWELARNSLSSGVEIARSAKTSANGAFSDPGKVTASVDESETSYTSARLSNGTWYVHVASYDPDEPEVLHVRRAT